ncbi:MAG: HesA/MoeB/ThiF family protein [Rickettsiales bacterium]
MDNVARQRYARQISLPEWGEDGQECLKSASVFVAGIGGLGSVAARYLVGAGVGRVALLDIDAIELSNLHRQILYDENDVDRLKILAAAEKLRAVNSEPIIETHDALPPLHSYDMIVDCTDNFPARFALHKAAAEARLPYLYAAAEAYRGALCLFAGHEPSSPCLHCFIPKEAVCDAREGCARLGVFPSLPGVIGAMAAAECVRYVLRLGELSPGRLTRYDALSGECGVSRVTKDPECACRDNVTTNIQ